MQVIVNPKVIPEVTPLNTVYIVLDGNISYGESR
jgi:hypothetical protein